MPEQPQVAALQYTLVMGASGYIGSQLVPRLQQQGHTVRAAARSPEVLRARDWDGVEVVAADVLQAHTLPAALAQVQTAYYLVHSMAAGKDFGMLDLRAAANFAAAAATAGVRRIIYLGGLVPDSADSEHIVSRKQTGDILREGRVPVTELRAGIIVGPGSAAFEVMRDLVMHLPLMITPRWVKSMSPPIALDNLLDYLVALSDAAADRADLVYDAAGPEYLTYEQMMRILAAEAGRKPPRILHVPLLTPKLSSYWLHLVTSVPTPIARALIEGMRQDFHADAEPLRQRVPLQLMDFRSAVCAAFTAEARHAVVSRWTEGAFAMRNHRREHAFYAKRASGNAASSATPQQLWQVLTQIGGDKGYFFLNGLWRIRETMDWMVGGPGLKHGRRDPQRLRVGDMVDSWRVIALQPARSLTLFFGMRAPGSGVLEFVISERPGQGSTLSATAYWHPAGVWGLLYWYALVPIHRIIFNGMCQAIAREAEVSALGQVGVSQKP